MTALNKQALRETAVLADRLKIDRLKICGSTVLALLDELEAAEKRIAELDKRLIEYAGIATREARRVAELEAKLANPVLLPKTNGYWTEQEKVYEDAITLAKRQIRLAGFRCEGDE
ncbi:ead/Ea22-like family protein [Salmonella enterica subsp. enterica]|nr:ead/Ea22-like family protein [Salmonella enterica subsp. enterica]